MFLTVAATPFRPRLGRENSARTSILRVAKNAAKALDERMAGFARLALSADVGLLTGDCNEINAVCLTLWHVALAGAHDLRARVF